MKSRGMYETPGGTILLLAHRGIESITLDRGAAHLKDELMPKYAELIYNGFWFSPEREMLQALIDKSQELVTGEVRLKLYKGGVHVIGRESPYSLYDQDLVTFEEGAVAYDHRDAAGFIKLNALRLRTTLAQREEARPSKAKGVICQGRHPSGERQRTRGSPRILRLRPRMMRWRGIFLGPRDPRTSGPYHQPDPRWLGLVTGLSGKRLRRVKLSPMVGPSASRAGGFPMTRAPLVLNRRRFLSRAAPASSRSRASSQGRPARGDHPRRAIGRRPTRRASSGRGSTGRRASHFDVATSDTFGDVRHSVFVDALPESDFTAKALLDGLPSGQDIFYRVRVEDLADVNATARADHRPLPHGARGPARRRVRLVRRHRRPGLGHRREPRRHDDLRHDARSTGPTSSSTRATRSTPTARSPPR